MRSSAIALSVLLLAGTARASEADDLLARIDEALGAISQKVWVVNMRIIGGEGDVREAKMLMLQGGTEKRLLRFLAPATMRNTALLTIGSHDFYVFMGQEGRTRRLGTSALNQTFMGSDFTFEDLGSVYLRDLYTPRVVSKSADETILELTPKGESNWSRLRVFADSHALARRIEYYDKAGRHVRTRTATFKQGELRVEAWFPQRLLMINEVTKHATELSVQVADADRSIPPDVFTLRGLQRGDDLHFVP
jgi:hypothetical protein